MRWRRRRPDPELVSVGRVKQWTEIQVAALYEAQRQQRVRHAELEARVRAIEEQPAAWSYPRRVEL